MIQANLLSDLYWFTRVVEAGSFSAAAENTGIGKSSLSRRIMQLEQRLDVQLLNRSTRQFTMTTVGEQIYRHALDMLAAAEAATLSAQETLGSPSGLVRLAAPGILADWLLEQLSGFREHYPKVSFALTRADALLELRAQRLDLSLSLGDTPRDSGEIVARPLATLDNVIVGNRALLDRLHHPRDLVAVEDANLLAQGSPHALQPWRLAGRQRTLLTPALSADTLLSLRDAALAGVGLACLPLAACVDQLRSGALLRACPDEHPDATTLYALTPSYRGITHTTRNLLQFLRERLAAEPRQGIEPAAAGHGHNGEK